MAHFQVGGALRPDALYVPRPADTELPRRLLAGEFCYVLAPRQMGKSSLRFRTASELFARGVCCVHMDLSVLGTTGLDPETWYLGLLEVIGDELGVESPLALWGQLSHLPVVQRWLRVLRTWMERDPDRTVVLFLDELDTVRALPFSTDDLFIAIRSIFNERHGVEAWRRLSVCLFGVARPSDLVRDARRTPFNIGTAVRLEDFTRAEALAFLPGLVIRNGDPRVWLDAVLHWTHGHPYMTQRCCESLSELTAGEGEVSQIADRLVRRLFLYDGEHSDVNLQSAAHQIQCAGDRRQALISLYRRVRSRATVPVSEANDDIAALLLTGMVSRQYVDGRVLLQVRNAIFEHVFDLDWVERQEGRRPLTQPLVAWLSARARLDEATPDELATLLLSGERLAEGLAWADGRTDVTPEERDYLLRSQERARAVQEEIASAEKLARQSALRELAESEKGREAARAAELQANIRRLEEVQRRQAADNQLLIEAAERARLRVTAQRRFIVALLFALLALVAGALAWWRESVSDQRLEEAGLMAIRERRAAIASLLSTDSRQAIPTLVEMLGVLGPRNKEGIEKLPDTVETGLYDSLWSREVLSPVELWRSDGRVYAVTSPDGRRMAVADQDGRVHLWDGVDAAAPSREIHGGDPKVRFLVFSNTGAHLAGMSQEHGVMLWSLSDATVSTTSLPSTKWAFSDPEFDPQDRRLITVDGHVARLWDLRMGVQVAELEHAYYVADVRFSADGRRILTACADGTLALWDAETGILRRRWRAHSDWAMSADFLDAGERIVSLGADRDTAMWADTDEPLWRFRQHDSTPRYITLSSDRTHLLSYGEGGEVRLLDLVRAGAPSVSLTLHRDTVERGAFSADGRYAATAGADGRIGVWDVQSRELAALLLGHGGAVTNLAFLAQGSRLLSSGADGRVLLWDFADQAADVDDCTCSNGATVGSSGIRRSNFVHKTFLSVGGEVFVRCGAAVSVFDQTGTMTSRYLGPEVCLVDFDVSTDGQRLAGLDIDGGLWEWHAGQATPTRTTHDELFRQDNASIIYAQHAARDLLTLSRPNDKTMWLLETGASRPFRPDIQWRGDARWTSDGAKLVAGAEGGVVHVLDEAGRLLRTLAPQVEESAAALLVHPAPSGDLVAVGYDNERVIIWSLSTGRMVQQWNQLKAQVSALAWSPSGARLAAGSRTGEIFVLDPAAGEILDRFDVEGSPADSLTFDPSERRLLVITDSGRVQLRDIDQKRRIASPSGGRKALGAAFSSDGQRVLTGHMDGRVRTWPLSVDAAARRACELLAPLPEHEEVADVCASWR